MRSSTMLMANVHETGRETTIVFSTVLSICLAGQSGAIPKPNDDALSEDALRCSFVGLSRE